jgi:hypothetical protein
MIGSIQILMALFLKYIITDDINNRIEDSVIKERSRKQSLVLDIAMDFERES